MVSWWYRWRKNPGQTHGFWNWQSIERFRDYDITTTDQEEIKALGLDQLRFGDFVALEDCDNRFGRSYRRGAVSVGIVVHSDCLLAGHGPGVTTLFTAIDGSLAVRIDPEANLARLLGIGSYR